MTPAPPGAPVIAHGIDLAEVSRIGAMVERHGDRFLTRCFTPAELAYANPARRRNEHLAARFAAKEAVFKAIGTGWARGVGWLDCEVTRDPSGAPGVRLSGRAAEIASALGIAAWLLSLSHSGGLAIASAVALGPPAPGEPAVYALRARTPKTP